MPWSNEPVSRGEFVRHMEKLNAARKRPTTRELRDMLADAQDKTAAEFGKDLAQHENRQIRWIVGTMIAISAVAIGWISLWRG